MARQREFDTEKVLDSIKNLFWKKGFNGTSISDLEKVSGITRTSLYQAFGNKQQLYLSTDANLLLSDANFLFTLYSGLMLSVKQGGTLAEILDAMDRGLAVLGK